MRQVVQAVFFFQAEDGIRDLVRSRGLGDVYKRQPLARTVALRGGRTIPNIVVNAEPIGSLWTPSYHPVSYTHLTLPTSDLV